jgi:hypothetical protein
MDKKSSVLIAVFILALVTALGYSYYRYVSSGDFLIDESQVEAEEETIDEAAGEIIPEGGTSTEGTEPEAEAGA